MHHFVLCAHSQAIGIKHAFCFKKADTQLSHAAEALKKGTVSTHIPSNKELTPWRISKQSQQIPRKKFFDKTEILERMWCPSLVWPELP